ncbi:hypothetical protein Anapl_05294 [Anas platyrhynchos]|uniref:Uncharacterized protein n=1 Tax=Anas platyrhynchos TaxID=8839 RepID=R0LTQ5_ANAPL|nr:hypothetical protein Anapl_05294 [Anas platyrhynchos]
MAPLEAIQMRDCKTLLNKAPHIQIWTPCTASVLIQLAQPYDVQAIGNTVSVVFMRCRTLPSAVGNRNLGIKGRRCRKQAHIAAGVSGVDAVLLRPSDSCKRRHTAVRADTRAAFAQFMQNIKLKNKQTKIDDQNQSVYLNLGSQL